MLNRINNLLKQEEMIRKERTTTTQEVLEAAKLLGINLETSNTIVKNEITINKGKIIEINNTAEIEQLKNEVKVYKGMVAGYEAQLQNKDLTIESLERQIADIKEEKLDLQDDIEVKDAMIDLLSKNIKALELQIAELTKPRTVVEVEVIDDPMFNDVEEEPEIVVEEDDAMPLFNVPKEYKDNQKVKSVVEKHTNDYMNAKEQILGGTVIRTVEQVKEQILVKANNEIQVIITELQKADQYKISYKELYNDKNQTVVAVKGKITLAGKEYVFKYGATHELPCVYGCMNMDLIKEAKEALDKTVHMIKDETEQKHAYEVVYAFDKGIVAWQTNDGAFKGYTKEYAFVWDGTSAVPCGATVKNALDEMKPYRKMNASWGNGFVQRANDIMAFCKTIDKHSKSTKEVKVETNEEKPNVSVEIDDLDI